MDSLPLGRGRGGVLPSSCRRGLYVARVWRVSPRARGGARVVTCREIDLRDLHLGRSRRMVRAGVAEPPPKGLTPCGLRRFIAALVRRFISAPTIASAIARSPSARLVLVSANSASVPPAVVPGCPSSARARGDVIQRRYGCSESGGGMTMAGAPSKAAASERKSTGDSRTKHSEREEDGGSAEGGDDRP